MHQQTKQVSARLREGAWRLTFAIAVALLAGRLAPGQAGSSAPPTAAPAPMPRTDRPLPAGYVQRFLAYDCATRAVSETPAAAGTEPHASILGTAPSSPVPESFSYDLTTASPRALPWQPVVRVFFRSNNQAWLGTGVLIDARTVLTAAHLLFSDNDHRPRVWSDSVQVFPDHPDHSFGTARAEALFCASGWVEYGNVDSDMGWIRLDRPIGHLTTWVGYGFNDDRAFFTGNHFGIGGYPGFEPGGNNYPGAPNQLYRGYGTFDDTRTYRLLADTAWSRLIGGMSGSPCLWFGPGNVAFGVFSYHVEPRTATTRIGCCRMESSRFLFTRDTVVPGAYGPLLDLTPMNVTAPATIIPGLPMPGLSYLVVNNSNANPPSASYSVTVRASVDPRIDNGDAVIGTHSFVHDFAPRSTYRVIPGAIIVPPTLATGSYWLGVQINTSDARTGNNLTNNLDDMDELGQNRAPTRNWDAAPVRASNDECDQATPLATGRNGPFNNSRASSSNWPWQCGRIGMGNDIWFSFRAAVSGTLTVQTCGLTTLDTVVEIYGGSCGALHRLGCSDDACGSQSAATVPITSAGQYFVRVGSAFGSGQFYLEVDHAPTTAVPYGQGCYPVGPSFYEVFSHAREFDLSGTAMRLHWRGDGYSIGQGGAFCQPGPLAVTLPLVGGDEVGVPLATGFPCAAGLVRSLVVQADGHVGTVSGVRFSGRPRPAAWRYGPRWGCWHRMHPGAAGSGRVKFEQVGGVAYVTWDGVLDDQGVRNNWQLQFDLASGDVTYVFGEVTPVRSGNNEYLVGYAADDEAGGVGMDISAALPFVTTSVARGALQQAASAPPRLGSTIRLDTNNVPGDSRFVFQLLGTTQHEPGIDLRPLGMPRCQQYLDAVDAVLRIPSSGTASYSLVIPAVTALAGVRVQAQSVAHGPGLNPANLISSNGLSLHLGY